MYPRGTKLTFFVMLSAFVLAGSACCASDARGGNKAPSGRASGPRDDKIVIGLNPNVLICTLAKEYGLNIVRNKEGGPYEPVHEPDLPKESLSFVKDRNLERWGPRFALRKDNGIVGIFQIGVVADANAAREMLQDQIGWTEMGPNRMFGSELGDEAVGWWSKSRQAFGRILLRRSNVVASISTSSPGEPGTKVSLDFTLRLAQQLDSALRSGSDGVRRGASLKVPRIVAVELPKEPSPRREERARVHIAVPARAQAEKSEEAEVVREVSFYPPLAIGDNVLSESELRWELVYITADCIVSSKVVHVQAVHVPSTP